MEALLEQYETTYSPVAILEWMNALERDVKIKKVIKSLRFGGIIAFKQLSHCRRNIFW